MAMSEVSEISDDSIPTSAHALQKQKEAKVLQQLEADAEAKRSLLLWISLGAIGLTGTAVSYLLGDHVKESQRRKGRRGDSFGDDAGMSDEMVEDDEFAMEASQFVRKKKRNIKGKEEEKAEDLLTSKEFLDFLEAYE